MDVEGPGRGRRKLYPEWTGRSLGGGGGLVATGYDWPPKAAEQFSNYLEPLSLCHYRLNECLDPLLTDYEFLDPLLNPCHLFGLEPIFIRLSPDIYLH